MGTTISGWRSLALSASLLLAITLIACGGDSEPPASAPAAAPTVAAPAPATVQAPTPTATPELPAPELEPEDLAARAFPDELLTDSERLTADEVAAIYTEYLGGARTVQSNGQLIYDTCSDGTGILVKDIAYTGEEFTWLVQKDRGGRWNAGVIQAIFDGGVINAGEPIRFIISVPVDGNLQSAGYAGSVEVEVLESPDCD